MIAMTMMLASFGDGSLCRDCGLLSAEPLLLHTFPLLRVCDRIALPVNGDLHALDCEERLCMKCSWIATQAGAKPTEAHKRTLELESPAAALGPAEKKRIIDGSTAGTAAAGVLKHEPVSLSHAEQNGVAAQQRSSAPPAAAEPKQESPSGQAIKQKESAEPAGAQSAGHEGDVSMSKAGGAESLGAKSFPTAGSKQSSAAPNGVSLKQEQQDGAGANSAQQSREATPELKLERLDGRTGQVRCIHTCNLALVCEGALQKGRLLSRSLQEVIVLGKCDILIRNLSVCAKYICQDMQHSLHCS